MNQFAVVRVKAATMDGAVYAAKHEFCSVWDCVGWQPRTWPFQITAVRALHDQRDGWLFEVEAEA